MKVNLQGPATTDPDEPLWSASYSTAWIIIGLVRVVSACFNPIADCDEAAYIGLVSGF